MAIGRIGDTNLLNSLIQTQKKLNNSFSRLSSGKKSFSDSPASQAIAQALQSQSSGYNQANRNISAASATLRTAQGGLDSVAEDLQRLREVAVQSANGILSNSDRAALQQEFQSLSENIDSVASGTSFNGTKLLDGSFNSAIQTGPNAGDTAELNIESASTSSLGISDQGVSTQEAASDAIEKIDAALEQVNAERARLGAAENALEFRQDANAVAAENLAAAESNLSDVDFSEEVIELTKQKIQQQAQIQVLKLKTETEKNLGNQIFGEKKKIF